MPLTFHLRHAPAWWRTTVLTGKSRSRALSERTVEHRRLKTARNERKRITTHAGTQRACRYLPFPRAPGTGARRANRGSQKQPPRGFRPAGYFFHTVPDLPSKFQVHPTPGRSGGSLCIGPAHDPAACQSMVNGVVLGKNRRDRLTGVVGHLPLRLVVWYWLGGR